MRQRSSKSMHSVFSWSGECSQAYKVHRTTNKIPMRVINSLSYRLNIVIETKRITSHTQCYLSQRAKTVSGQDAQDGKRGNGAELKKHSSMLIRNMNSHISVFMHFTLPIGDPIIEKSLHYFNDMSNSYKLHYHVTYHSHLIKSKQKL